MSTWAQMSPAERRVFWAAMLRSGLYSQNRADAGLRSVHFDTYNVWGVLSDLSHMGRWDGCYYIYNHDVRLHFSSIDPLLLTQVGLGEGQVGDLNAMAEEQMTFALMADYLEFTL